MDDEKFKYALKKIADVARKKSCKHDWRVVCWTSDYKIITYGCPRCELMECEALTERQQHLIKVLLRFEGVR